jgi:hypothetical protein
MGGPRQAGIGWEDLPRERQRRLVVLIGRLIVSEAYGPTWLMLDGNTAEPRH